MSSRALRRLKGKQRGQEALDLGDLVPDEGPEPEEQAADVEEEELEEAVLQPAKSSIRKAKKNKKNLSNIYELVECLSFSNTHCKMFKKCLANCHLAPPPRLHNCVTELASLLC